MASLIGLSDDSLASALGMEPAQIARAAAVFAAVHALPIPPQHQAEVLEALSEGPGADIGPTYARALVDLGPVPQLSDLTQVKGVGPKRLKAVASALAAHTAADAWTSAGLPPPGSGSGSGSGSEELAALQLAVAALQEARLVDQQRIASLEARLASLEAASDTIPSEPVPSAERVRVGEATGLNALALSAGEQLHEARSRLMGSRQGLRLGDVELQLRGEAGATADARLGLRLGEAQGDLGRLSEVTLRYDVQGPATGRADPAQVLVPAVGGYTEALARRKLAKVGLEAEVSLQTGAPGQARTVVAQRPGAGATAQPGSTVQLYLGM